MKQLFKQTRRYAALGTLLVLILMVLIWKARSVDTAQSDAILTKLIELKQITAAWNVEVLRAQAVMANLNPAAKPLAVIEKLETDLRDAVRGYLKDDPQALVQIDLKLDAFSALLHQKVLLIEQFKSQNMILRDAGELLHISTQALAYEAQASGAPIQTQIKFERTIDQIYASVMVHLQNGDDERRERIQDSLIELQAASPLLGAHVVESTEAVVTQIQAVLLQRNTAAQFLKAISNLHTAAAFDDMHSAYVKANNTRINQLQTYQHALMLYSAFLLLLISFMGYKLLRHYQAIQQANAKLEIAYADLQESQVHLVQSEKMSALGQMVAGIAHEINTPLAYLKASFNVIQEQLSSLERVLKDSRALALALRGKPAVTDELGGQASMVDAGTAQVIHNDTFKMLENLAHDGIHGIDQISEIVINLKNFSRLDREKVMDFSVEKGLDSTLLLARSLIKYTVTVVKDYGYTPNLVGSPSQINQVFLNLIINAAQAMPQRPVDENIVRLRTRFLVDEQLVQIEVEDNGKGIAPKDLPRVFDPFYTTKPIGQGTGMGLSISYKIIQEHGGRIEVKSTQDVGTTFTVWLPLVNNNELENSLTTSHSGGHQALVD